MTKPFIIGIAGESGVGKSTVSGIISLFYKQSNTVAISTDDLHKWERKSEEWLTHTHLDPNANNLELGDLQLTDLFQGRPVYRSIYNHSTGCFNPPKKIESKPVIINDGLHAFYTDIAKSLTDLKIFVNTSDNLRTHWKLVRDTEERGYKYNEVLEIIEKRRLDSHNIKNNQISIADVIIDIEPKSPIIRMGDKHELITLSVSVKACNTKAPKELLDFISNYMNDFSEFIKISETEGHSLEMCQDGGGNISVKTNDLMIIKASGFNMKDVHRLSGYSVLHNGRFEEDINNDHELNEIMALSTGTGYKRASMETGMHAVLSKYVLHAHPIYITLLLCLKNSPYLVKQAIPFDFNYIPYTNPGYNLFNAIRQSKNKSGIFLLENHGVVIAGDNPTEATNMLFEINNLARKFIELTGSFKPFDLSFNEITTYTHPFPDSVMFLHNPIKLETIAAHNYIHEIGGKIGKVRTLSNQDVMLLKNMESEKYRQTL